MELDFVARLFRMSEKSSSNYDHKMAALLPPARVLGTYYQGGSVFAVSHKFKERDVTLLDTKSNNLLELDKQGLGVLEPGADYVINSKIDNQRRKSKTFEYMTMGKQRRTSIATIGGTMRKTMTNNSRSQSGVQGGNTDAPITMERRRSVLPEFASTFHEVEPVAEPITQIDPEDIIKRLKVPPFKGYLEVQSFKESKFTRRQVELIAFNVIVTTGEMETDRVVYTLNKNAMALISEKAADDYNFDLFAGTEMVTFKCISKAQMMAWVSSINTSCMNLLLLEILPGFDMKDFTNTLEKSFKYYAQKVNANIEEELNIILKHLIKYSSSKKVTWGASSPGPKAETQTAVNFFTVLTARRSIKRSQADIKKATRLIALKSAPKSIEFVEEDEDLINQLHNLVKSVDNLDSAKEKSPLEISEQNPDKLQFEDSSATDLKASKFSLLSFNGEDESFLEELYKVVEQSDFLPENKKNEIKEQAKQMSSFLSKNQSEIFSNSALFEIENEEAAVKITEEISRIPDLRSPVKIDDSNLGMLKQDSWDELGNPQVYYARGADNQTTKFDIGAASIDKLIERIADHCGPADENYLKTIFLCHRHVIDSQSLLKKILSRMNSEVDQNDEKFSRLHLHTRMIKAVSLWIELYWVDFNSPEMQLLLQGFLAIVEDNVTLTNNAKFKTLSEYFSSLIQTKIEESTARIKTADLPAKAPKILTDNFILAYSPQTISKSLTDLEFERLQKLQPLETLLQLWNPSDNSESYPNLHSSVNAFNNVFYQLI